VYSLPYKSTGKVISSCILTPTFLGMREDDCFPVAYNVQRRIVNRRGVEGSDNDVF